MATSAPVQWAPSHVGVQGYERTDEGAVRGPAQAFRAVVRDREVRDIWSELGLEEMDGPSDGKKSGGVTRWGQVRQ